ncbi:hypothetical protein ACFXAW_32865 [Streptomyces sp. NPDC059445]|uniref:hypothetical protein n=1 Tax=Streptomyces sp. NPDC059445 TaxID=3346832 RepID=UPI0036BA9DDA
MPDLPSDGPGDCHSVDLEKFEKCDWPGTEYGGTGLRHLPVGAGALLGCCAPEL